jgi:phage FluMu protein Com
VPYITRYYTGDNMQKKNAYTSFVRDFGTNKISAKRSSRKAVSNRCNECGAVMKRDTNVDQSVQSFVCPKCAVVNFVNIDEHIMHSDSTCTKSDLIYRKSGRFITWLMHVQGKKEAPYKITQAVMNEKRRDGINDDDDSFTIEKVKEYLKITRNQAYYDYAPRIYYNITAKPLPVLTHDDIKFFETQYNLIFSAFRRVCSSTRKSMFKNPFTIRKIVKQYPQYGYLEKYFPQLKDDKNLKSYEQDWEKICPLIGYTMHREF